MVLFLSFMLQKCESPTRLESTTGDVQLQACPSWYVRHHQQQDVWCKDYGTDGPGWDRRRCGGGDQDILQAGFWYCALWWFKHHQHDSQPEWKWVRNLEILNTCELRLWYEIVTGVSCWNWVEYCLATLWSPQEQSVSFMITSLYSVTPEHGASLVYLSSLHGVPGTGSNTGHRHGVDCQQGNNNSKVKLRLLYCHPPQLRPATPGLWDSLNCMQSLPNL